jgi:hypothetical protein
MLRCEIGGCYKTPVEGAHIKGRGAGGTNKKHNKIRLCVFHHRLDDNSLHRIGTWAFAKLHGLTERFELAYEIERKLEQEKREKNFKKIRGRQAGNRKKYCPTCKRRWSKGVIKGEQDGRE